MSFACFLFGHQWVGTIDNQFCFRCEIDRQHARRMPPQTFTKTATPEEVEEILKFMESSDAPSGKRPKGVG